MKKTTMEFGVIKEEQFVTEDKKTFDNFDEAAKHQQNVFRSGIKLNLETVSTSFGDSVVMPRKFKSILVFMPGGPLLRLAHQLYAEDIFEALKTLEAVKVLGLDENKQPIEIIIVATRDVQK